MKKYDMIMFFRKDIEEEPVLTFNLRERKKKYKYFY